MKDNELLALIEQYSNDITFQQIIAVIRVKQKKELNDAINKTRKETWNDCTAYWALRKNKREIKLQTKIQNLLMKLAAYEKVEQEKWLLEEQQEQEELKELFAGGFEIVNNQNQIEKSTEQAQQNAQQVIEQTIEQKLVTPEDIEKMLQKAGI